MKKNENNKSQNNGKNTTVVCPVCGAEFAIAEHEHMVSGMAIGKDSGLGRIELPLDKAGRMPNKADERLEALKKAGVDTTNMFAMQNASGNGMLVRVVNGIPSVINDDDPVFAAIIKGGTIPDRHLFRRWVMAQMFDMLASGDYTNTLHLKGYEYTWRMAVEEYRVQARMLRNDVENFVLRNIWFDKRVAVAMAEDYIWQLGKYLKSLKVRHCKGVEYKRVHGRNVFVSDFNKVFFLPLKTALTSIHIAKSMDELYKAMAKFNSLRVELPWNTRQCPAWVDAYKGSGAYFTMKNMILFHGCTFGTRSQAYSMKHLNKLRNECMNGEGWRLLGILKEFIESNGIDIKAKMASWRKK